MKIFGWLREFASHRSNKTVTAVLDESLHKVLARGAFPKCGGCGAEPLDLSLVFYKKRNSGFLCKSCSTAYSTLLQPSSIRNFWMCGICGYRILAGTAIDAAVDKNGGRCPNCTTDVNLSLVNLRANQPTGRGIVGEPMD
jgi:hypothetical protein